jgi:hypothetical protein
MQKTFHQQLVAHKILKFLSAKDAHVIAQVSKTHAKSVDYFSQKVFAPSKKEKPNLPRHVYNVYQLSKYRYRIFLELIFISMLLTVIPDPNFTAQKSLFSFVFILCTVLVCDNFKKTFVCLLGCMILTVLAQVIIFPRLCDIEWTSFFLVWSIFPGIILSVVVFLNKITYRDVIQQLAIYYCFNYFLPFGSLFLIQILFAIPFLAPLLFFFYIRYITSNFLFELDPIIKREKRRGCLQPYYSEQVKQYIFDRKKAKKKWLVYCKS